jgi:hypothetical protein
MLPMQQPHQSERQCLEACACMHAMPCMCHTPCVVGAQSTALQDFLEQKSAVHLLVADQDPVLPLLPMLCCSDGVFMAAGAEGKRDAAAAAITTAGCIGDLPPAVVTRTCFYPLCFHLPAIRCLSVLWPSQDISSVPCHAQPTACNSVCHAGLEGGKLLSVARSNWWAADWSHYKLVVHLGTICRPALFYQQAALQILTVESSYADLSRTLFM